MGSGGGPGGPGGPGGGGGPDGTIEKVLQTYTQRS